MTQFFPTGKELAAAAEVLARVEGGAMTKETGRRVFAACGVSAWAVGRSLDVAGAVTDPNDGGCLFLMGTAAMMRLVGWAQSGKEVSPSLLSTPGPPPKLDGVSFAGEMGKGCPILPTLAPATRARYEKQFRELARMESLVDAEGVLDAFLESGLPNEQLVKIWAFCDTRKRGGLDILEFTLAMYLIASFQHGYIDQLPSPPPAMIPAASRREIPNSSDDAIPAESTPSQQLGRTLPSSGTQAQSDWDVTPEEKSESDYRFDLLDTENNGYVEGVVAAKYITTLDIDGEDAALIWDLVDFDRDNHLSRDAFAVAMHLAQRRLSGHSIPSNLPPTLIPPSRRDNTKPHPNPFGVELPISFETSTEEFDATQEASPILDDSDTAYEPPLTSLPDESMPLVNDVKGKTRLTPEELLSQLLEEYREKNSGLEKENESLRAKLDENEQIISQLLSANETISAADMLRRRSRRLTRKIAFMEQVNLRLTHSTLQSEDVEHENTALRQRIRELEEAESTYIRDAEAAEDLRRQIAELKQDNETLRGRAAAMEVSLMESQSSGAEASAAELRILLGHATRENDELQRRMREVQESFVSDAAAQREAAVELERQKAELGERVEELEHWAAENREWRQVSEDLTRENDRLRAELREANQKIAQSRPSRAAEELEREVVSLKGEMHRLRIQLQDAPTINRHPREDAVPPPAYDDSFTI